MANNHSELEKRLWDSADDLLANSKLKSAEYFVPVLKAVEQFSTTGTGDKRSD